MELEPDPDTLLPDNFSLDLKKDGTSNDLNRHEQFAGAEVDLLGDGVNGPEAPDLGGNDDEIAQQIEDESDDYTNQGPFSITPKMEP